ncbi:light-harvesting complex-like protein OHP2, chloroplastic [Ananas comosus]|uniref:Light-harvesting complex-like protein OHP2, chloroplastic n=1 Tax=Ananas comosus TaxID=4615 RepID=A0A6P5GBB1_ANACO|nr:light-harvesting complex-like protein OHP2, chloroplastic [Ananas comosus]
MSLASSIPSIKIKVAPPHHYHHHNPCKFPSKPFTTIKSSKAEGPLRRPTAPSLSPPPPSPPSPPSSSSSSSSSSSLSPPPSISASPPVKPTSPSPPKPATTAAAAAKEVVTLEYQRKVAKELQDYFKQKKLEEADQGPFFGFTVKNEIANGRWAMFGFAVGLLTEYATGSDFVQQLKILFSNFGIVDLE